MLGKYIVVIKNEKKFIDHKFDIEERIEKSSILTWHPLTLVLRTDYVHKILRTRYEMNDSIWNLGSMTLEDETGFFSFREPNRELTIENDVQTSVTFEMSFEQRVYNRKVYSVLDLLAELGGLFGTLGALSFMIIFLIQYRGVYQFIMADLFIEKGAKP